MSVESSTAVIQPAAVPDPQIRKVLRYALGATLCMAVAQGFGWPMSFLAPPLALALLAAPSPLGWKAAIGVLAIIGAACLAGLLLVHFLLPYPLIYVPIIGLLLFRIYYAKATGAPPRLIIWLLLALVALPLVAMQSPSAAEAVAGGILTSATVTLIVVHLVWFVIPDGPGRPDAAVAAEPTPPAPTAAMNLRNAALSTALVFPLMTIFMVLEQTGNVLNLFFVAMLSMQPGFAGSFKMGAALILGNAMGGVTTLVFYQLLEMVPVFPFMLLLTLFSGLMFGAQVFSGKKTGPIFGFGFTAVLLVVGATTTSSGDAEFRVITRVMQIMAAVVYVVLAGGLLERLTRRKEIRDVS